jgi:hypothetical protein
MTAKSLMEAMEADLKARSNPHLIKGKSGGRAKRYPPKA